MPAATFFTGPIFNPVNFSGFSADGVLFFSLVKMFLFHAKDTNIIYLKNQDFATGKLFCHRYVPIISENTEKQKPNLYFYLRWRRFSNCRVTFGTEMY